MAKRKHRLDKIEQYLTRGWAPASYRHLRPELRQLIRAIRFRPGFKECWQNCQRIVLAVAIDHTEFSDRLEYHEGILLTRGIPIAHAWLKLDGVIQDPTLCSKHFDEYGPSHVYTVDVIRDSMLRTRMWGPVDCGAINALMIDWVTRGRGLPES